LKHIDKLKICVGFLIEIIFPRDFDVFELREELNGGFLSSKKDDVHYLFKYKNKFVKQAIWEMKFKRNKQVAEFFGKFMAVEILENIDIRKNYLLIPTPIHKKRRVERGFNQCEWLCKEIMKNLEENGGNSTSSIKYSAKILLRKEYTTKQSWSNKNEREKNLKGVFQVSEKFQSEIVGAKIILIDDVLTTGSTIREMHRTFSKSGASEIISIVVAH